MLVFRSVLKDIQIRITLRIRTIHKVRIILQVVRIITRMVILHTAWAIRTTAQVEIRTISTMVATALNHTTVLLHTFRTKLPVRITARLQRVRLTHIIQATPTIPTTVMRRITILRHTQIQILTMDHRVLRTQIQATVT